MSQPASTSANGTAASASAEGEPQLYMEELSLQECLCVTPTLLPRFRRWNKKTSAGKKKAHPEARGGHASVWIDVGSSAQGSVLIFGGSNRQVKTFSDVWRFDVGSNEWSAVNVTGTAPSLRSGHSAVYDRAGQRVIYFGGQQMQMSRNGEMDMKFFRDVWALNCKTWSWQKLPDTGDAPQRNGHTATMLDSDHMVIFGGSDASGPSTSVYTYNISTSTWQSIATTGSAPEARELHAASVVETAVGKYLLVTGGRGVNSLLNTCYALRLSATAEVQGHQQQQWQWFLVGQCPPRCGHSLLPLHATSSNANVVPLLAADANVPATVAAASKDSSSSSSAAASASTASTATVLLFGGIDGTMFYNDVLSYTFDPSQLDASLIPPAPACVKCQGPPGWSMLAKPDEQKGGSEEGAAASGIPEEGEAEEEEEENITTGETKTTATGATVSTESSEASSSKKAGKKKKKKKDLTDVKPFTCFAQCLIPLPCPSPAFSHAAAASSSASSSSADALVPGTYLLYGGMNDENDIDDTHLLHFTPFH